MNPASPTGAAAGVTASQSAPPTVSIPVTLSVNGITYDLEIDPRVTLLDALRERLGLTGTKKGCDRGECGACTVHINGPRTARSQMTGGMIWGIGQALLEQSETDAALGRFLSKNLAGYLMPVHADIGQISLTSTIRTPARSAPEVLAS